MKLDQLRDYLTMPEIAARWRATEPDMCRGVLKGLLRPSVYLNGVYQRGHVHDDGRIELEAETEHLVGWHYLVAIQQVGPLDCSAHGVSVLPESLPGAGPLPGSRIWALGQPLSMRGVMSEAVMMAEDILFAEAAGEADTPWQQRSGKTKEFNSVLTLLSIVLWDCYRFDPRQRGEAARVAKILTDAGEQCGNRVSRGTAEKWIKEAYEQFQPLQVERVEEAACVN
jgi:hypothetical protein